jgi:hypothetical protein
MATGEVAGPEKIDDLDISQKVGMGNAGSVGNEL